MQIFLRDVRFTTVPWHSTINNATLGPWEYPPSTAPTKAAVSVRNNYLRQTKVQNPTFSPSWIDLTIIWQEVDVVDITSCKFPPGKCSISHFQQFHQV